MFLSQLRQLKKSTLPFPPASLEISLLIPAKNAAHTLQHTVEESYKYLQTKFLNSFEIILILTPETSQSPSPDASLQIAQSLTTRFKEVHICRHSGPIGKGAALKSGFQIARGNFIFFTDADLPYDLGFFDEAILKLKAGFDLITANRRLPLSYFHVPVRLLSLAYDRHRLGLLFNRFVRFIFPIKTSDTQAGIKALSRQLGTFAFSKQICPGFFFDIELFLTALSNQMKHAELPVTLYLNSEKTTVRLAREAFLALYWLSRIWISFHKRHYKDLARVHLPDYNQASILTRFFLKARWHWTPYEEMASYFPTQGEILDLGCGHGFLSLTLAQQSPLRSVHGIDHDTKRISLARNAIEKNPNLTFSVGDFSILKQTPQNQLAGLALIDVLHYFTPLEQESILADSFKILKPGGTLLFREVDSQEKRKYTYNKLHEKMMTYFGFTKAQALHFRHNKGWEEASLQAGFQVQIKQHKRFPFKDVLFICKRQSL